MGSKRYCSQKCNPLNCVWLIVLSTIVQNGSLIAVYFASIYCHFIFCAHLCLPLLCARSGNSPRLERRDVNTDPSVFIRNKRPFNSSFHMTLSSPPHGQDSRHALFQQNCSMWLMLGCPIWCLLLTAEGITQPHPYLPEWWRCSAATRNRF